MAAARGAASIDEEALPPAKWHLDGRERRQQHAQGAVAMATRSDCEKNKMYKKTRAKSRVYVNCINLIVGFINQ
jgi:hypothetical protein